MKLNLLDSPNNKGKDMPITNEWNDECYFCEACGKPFRSPLYDVTKDYERTEFYNEPRLPEIEVMGAEVIRSYCCSDCRDKKRQEFLQQEKIRATFPGIGPIEACSRCDVPIDMTKFHLTYVEMVTEEDWDRPMFGVKVKEAITIAVVCQLCEPVTRKISEAIEWDDDHSLSNQELS